MSKSTISPKEEFFRTKLIPAGQLTEVYLHHASRIRVAALSRDVFEILGLVSAFAISPSTPADTAIFMALGQSIEQIISLLRGDLVGINCAKPTSEQTRDFRAGQNSILERLKPHLDALLTTMKYVPQERGAWLENLMRTATPLTRNREYKKWRTFVRNLDFEQNMQSLGMRDVAKALPALGSHQGREEAPVLWRACFDSAWQDGQGLVQSAPYLPTGVEVKSTATGLLEVTRSYDHRKVLKKVLAPLPDTTPDVAKRLEVAVFSKTCHYTELAGTIAEVIAWIEEQSVLAESTKNIISKAAEESKMAALRAKLTSTFTPDELALLAKVNALSDVAVKVKPATRPRVRKP